MKKGKQKSESWWKCSSCGYTVKMAAPPESCPACKQTCAFTDVTCYTPECGGSQNIDPSLMGGDKR